MNRAPQAWLFGPATDTAVFAGSALVSVALAVWRPGVVDGETPLWAWLLLVVAIDVAHVWSTLFRTYLDRDELARRALLYAAAPVAVYVAGFVAYEHSPQTFWRLFAYAALLHFVRQQYGWVALYNRRCRASALDHRLDSLAVYASTLMPAVWWHANLPTAFAWFVPGDFATGVPRWVGNVALFFFWAALAVWGARQVQLQLTGATVQRGKVMVIGATAVVWFGGIVLAKDDFTFTAMNVILHGAPYFALLFIYARARAKEPGGYTVGSRLMRGGVAGFGLLVVALAFAEEWLWDVVVWHEHSSIFGAPIEAAELWPLLVPLLAVPQATHYVLDAFIWRGRDDPKLLERLGFRSPVERGPDPALLPPAEAPVRA